MKKTLLLTFLLTYILGFSQNNPCEPNEYFAYIPTSAQTSNTLPINQSYPEIFMVSSQGSLRFNYTLTVTEHYEVSFDNNSGYTSSISENNTNRISCYVKLKSGLPIGTYTGTLSISYDGATPTCDIAMSTEVTLSNSDFNYTKFEMYPNPTSDILNLNQFTDAEVFTIQGLKVAEYKNVNTINVNQLSSGIYILKTPKFNNLKFIKQ